MVRTFELRVNSRQSEEWDASKLDVVLTQNMMSRAGIDTE